MRCKCRYCDNKELDTKEAYCVTIKEKKYYFCNEEHYKLAVQRKTEEKKIKAEYDEIFELTKQIFGYAFAGYSLLKREINTWETLSNRQKIIAYLQENQDWLTTVMRKDFSGDYNRVRYFSTIVSSKLHDFVPTKKPIEVAKIPVVTEENVKTKYKAKARKALIDFEEEYEDE